MQKTLSALVPSIGSFSTSAYRTSAAQSRRLSYHMTVNTNVAMCTPEPSLKLSMEIDGLVSLSSRLAGRGDPLRNPLIVPLICNLTTG